MKDEFNTRKERGTSFYKRPDLNRVKCVLENGSRLGEGAGREEVSG